MEALPRLVGGNVALDLVNTADDDVPGDDHLRSDADVARWLAHVGLGGTATLRATRALRADLDAVFRPLAAGAAPAGALEALRRREAKAIAAATLTPAGYEWDDPLPRITHAAVELLHHGPVDRLRVCGNCPWLFLDLSRNGSRRWCSMEGCGTEVKIRRLTDRRQRRRGPTPGPE